MTIFTQKLVNFTNNYKETTIHPIKHEFLKTYTVVLYNLSFILLLSSVSTAALLFYSCIVTLALERKLSD